MKLGIQSITMWNEFAQDFYGTLAKMRDVGLHYAEWFNIMTKDEPGIGNGLSPKEAVRLFDDYGMKLTGGIFNCKNPKEELFDLDLIQKVIDWYAEAGCSTIGLATDFFVDEDFFKRRMELYNELGRRCKEAGMVWVYHNHFHEQQKLGDKTILDLMIENTDPETVAFDWDIFWGLRGFLDPVATIKKIGHRIKRLHCKDFAFGQLERVNLAKDLPTDVLMNWDNRKYHDAYKMIVPEDFIECGQGVIKWQDVVDAANSFDIPFMFVEQDYTKCSDRFESLRISKAYLENLRGLEIM